MTTQMFWYFVIDAREDEPGYVADVTYHSLKYKSFLECYKSYIVFDPHKYWTNLRSIRQEYFVYQHGDIVKKNVVIDGLFLNIKNIEVDLGITEKQFVATMERL